MREVDVTITLRIPKDGTFYEGENSIETKRKQPQTHKSYIYNYQNIHNYRQAKESCMRAWI